MGNKLYYTLIAVLALLFGTIAYCFASNEHYSGICVHVLDGDTVDVVDDGQNLHRIRITGMDAPELSQPYGQQANAELKELILGKEVTVIPMGMDKYKRELAILRINTTIGQIDVAECMINKGAAFDWGGKYYKAQDYAKANRLGLWQDIRFQERPWLYRRRIK